MPPAHIACAEQAAQYGHEFVVEGAFDTTVAGIRALTPGGQPVRWPELADSDEAFLCYLDGPVAKGPPPGVDGVVPRPFDRAVVGVARGRAELIMAGYRENLAIQAP